MNKFDDYYHSQALGIVYQPEGIELEMNYRTIKQFAHAMAKERYHVETTFNTVIGQDDKIIGHFKQRSVRVETAKVFNVHVAFEYQLEQGKIKNVWAISNRVWGP